MSMTLINVLPVPVPRHTMVFLSFARSRSSTWYGRAEKFSTVSPPVLLSEAFSMVSLNKITNDEKSLSVNTTTPYVGNPLTKKGDSTGKFFQTQKVIKEIIRIIRVVEIGTNS